MQQTFGERITALRKKAGMEQKDVAAELGVCRSTVGNWESGQNKTTMDYSQIFGQHMRNKVCI